MTTSPTDLDGAYFSFIFRTGYDTDIVIVVNKTDGTGVQDITGYSASMALKAGVRNPAALTLTTSELTGSRLSIPVGTDGKLYVHFDHADTDTLPGPINYDYDVRLTTPSGSGQRCVMWGTASTRVGVTPVV